MNSSRSSHTSATQNAPAQAAETESSEHPREIRIASLGGGHGLFNTLRGARVVADDVTAIVTVADDGGSSGRMRRELGSIPPGDLRMALAALTEDSEGGRLWEEAIQHRFGGYGALKGHAVGNLMISGLEQVLGSLVRALDEMGKLLGVKGRVLPMCPEPLDLEAEVSGLEEDPREVVPVRGQVAVATTMGQVRRVRMIPHRPAATPEAVTAIERADLITLGPGSWFSSVIPHILVPGLVDALNAAKAPKVLIMNLVAEAGETAGMSMEHHIHMVFQHAQSLAIDVIVVDMSVMPRPAQRTHVERAAHALGAKVIYRDVREDDARGRFGDRHKPAKMAAVFQEILSTPIDTLPSTLGTNG